MRFHTSAISAGLLLGLGLAAIQPGDRWAGWLLFSLLFLGVLYSLRAVAFWAADLSRQPSAVSSLLALLYLAFFLRLAFGVALYMGLPIGGHPNPQHQAGYIFFDSHRRDLQAWELAQSEAPLWNAFNKNFYSDQYGGLLALLTLLYRYLSPDAHRPLLPVLFGAWVATLGAAFLWKASTHKWDQRLARLATWIYALYPESLLLGSAQMREPFLMAFVTITMAGWVLAHERPTPTGPAKTTEREGWLWLLLGLLGMLIVSPAIALLTLILIAGWMWVTQEHRQLSWVMLAAAIVIFLAGVYLLAWGLERDQPFGSSPFGTILTWSRQAIRWDTYQLVRGSGWVQKLFQEMPEELHPLFVILYGTTQPVLPSAFIEPTVPLLRALHIVRALGWYALVPLLFYAPFAILRVERDASRRLWIWLLVITWIWILLCALRGGADVWDNPRYRVILIGVQAWVAAFAWLHRDRWLGRWLAAEAIFLIFFTQWYISRYYRLGPQLPFGLMILLIVLLAVGVFVGDWWWKRRSRRHTPNKHSGSRAD